MYVYDVNYTVKSKDNNKYILISDLHSTFNINIANYINDINDIKYVLISGDILNGYEWTNKQKLLQLKYFLDAIKENHEIIMTLGNHDLYLLNKKGFNNFKSLESNNIFPIYNESIILDNNRFTSFIPDLSTYSYSKQDKDKTINKILDNYNNKFEINENSTYIEHLLSHNPYHFYHEEMLNITSKYDLVETGHFHDGWVPTLYMDDNYKKLKDKGLRELIFNKLFLGHDNKINVNPKRILSRGIVYIYKDGYYLLLPNNEIYYYNKMINKYSLVNENILYSRLKQNKSTPIIISGAINTFNKPSIFFPHITTIKLTSDKIYEAKRFIKKI